MHDARLYSKYHKTKDVQPPHNNYESNLVFEERNKSSEFWNNAPKVLFKMLELIFLDTFSSHLDDLLGEGVLIDYEMSTICSECLADLVDLAGAYVGEVG